MRRILQVAFVIAVALGTTGVAQQLDVCGCLNHPQSLGNFDTLNAATWPPGTQQAFRSIQIQLPDDGVMVFDSMNLQPRPTDSGLLTVSFIKNAANTPVTLLVRGNVTITAQTNLFVGGANGGDSNTFTLGIGGVGGPGAYRGGDGAYRLVNFAAVGGHGLGPAGGAGGADTYYNAGNALGGTYVGATDLLPLVGGSGGGGGSSTTTGTTCSGGGGGGGGGALLIAVNGTLTVNGQINADGGSYGTEQNANCASGGGGGSGGAIRVLASSVVGTGNIYARGGSNRSTGRTGAGRIRVEALNNTMQVNGTDPIAVRAPGPGPITSLFNPTVAVTSVAGHTISATPQGNSGATDLVLGAPGVTSIDFATAGVPAGTTVNVTVKPRVGGAPATNTVPLNDCDPDGTCSGTTTFTLAAGAYFIEAQATFQTP